jgi:hypothetical protein
MSLKFKFSATFFLGLVLSLSALASRDFPQTADTRLTPGSLCARPTEHRYRERIPYCERDVTPDRKQRIMETYDREFNTRVT